MYIGLHHSRNSPKRVLLIKYYYKSHRSTLILSLPWPKCAVSSTWFGLTTAMQPKNPFQLMLNLSKGLVSISGGVPAMWCSSCSMLSEVAGPGRAAESREDSPSTLNRRIDHPHDLLISLIRNINKEDGLLLIYWKVRVSVELSLFGFPRKLFLSSKNAHSSM